MWVVYFHSDQVNKPYPNTFILASNERPFQEYLRGVMNRVNLKFALYVRKLDMVGLVDNRTPPTSSTNLSKYPNKERKVTWDT